MITTEIYKGQGLGNQLWCYVVTRVIAKDHGYTFGIQSPENFKCLNFMRLDTGEPVVGGSGPEGGPPQKLPVGITHYYRERKVIHPENGSDIRIHDPRLTNIADNTKIDGVMQDERYIAHRKDEIREWLDIDESVECFDFSCDDVCVINFRGGGYVQDRDVFLSEKYWRDAMQEMRRRYPHVSFVVITDDVRTAKTFFPELPVHHFSIGKDYAIIKNAHYLILSNSSFAWFPAWLSKTLKFCIAPKYWARHNTSDGYWSCGYNITSGWHYLDREGCLSDYETCKQELDAYIEAHPDYYAPTTVPRNFLVVSNHNHDVSWVPQYTENFLIYDRSDSDEHLTSIPPQKVHRVPNVGYNLYDYLTFIIDHYDSLPKTTVFLKGNTVPRHVTQEHLDWIINNEYFTPIEERALHNPVWPKGFFASDGGFSEANTSAYMHNQTKRYFATYNDFLRFCFVDPVIPRYVRFAPGGNYIVPREHILKIPKIFYENLRIFISYCPLPGEAHIIERALHTIWTAPFRVHPQMLRPIDPSMTALPPPDPLRGLKDHIPMSIKRATPASVRPYLIKIALRGRSALKKILALPIIAISQAHFAEYRVKNTWDTPEEIAEYRKTIKIYDVFTLFNELDLLELRLNILDEAVDYFVIIEATETFSGKPKPLYYQENKARFAKWHHKIIHHVTTDTPRSREELIQRLTNDTTLTDLDKEIINNSLTSDNIAPGALHWFKEFYQKESIKKALVGLKDDDICYISDVDEIWNPDLLIDYSKDDIFKLRQAVYAYFMNNRSSEPWAGTLVTKYRNIRENCLNHLRTARKTHYAYLRNGGWHFTNQGGADQIKKKLESYGHQEYNTPAVKESLERIIAANTDFIGRNFTFHTTERGLPKYLLEHKADYKHYFR